MAIEISIYDPTLSYQGQKKFDCGLKVIDKFVAGSLKQQVAKGLTVAYVLTDSSQNQRFVGFYTTMMASVGSDLLASAIAGSLPKQLGCLRLVMLGVDKAYKKQNLGLRLLKHAMLSMKIASKTMGCIGLYLDADPAAIELYRKFGFIGLEEPVPGRILPMFIPARSVA